MHTLKFSLLFSLLLFGAWSEYKAETAVKKIKSEEEKAAMNTSDITHEDIGFMDHAIRLSHRSINHDDDNAFGSVVVKDGRIIGEGWNKINQRHDPSAHAVVEAIRDACTNLSSSKLPDCYIYTSAHPCFMCLSLIHLSGIKKIFYSAPGEEINSSKWDSRSGFDMQELALPGTERQIPVIPIHPGDVLRDNQNP